MKVIELVKISIGMMEMMSKHDIKLNDWRYVKMYEEYTKMRCNRDKLRYIIAHLAEKYHVSESSVKRTIKRLSGEVKV